MDPLTATADVELRTPERNAQMALLQLAYCQKVGVGKKEMRSLFKEARSILGLEAATARARELGITLGPLLPHGRRGHSLESANLAELIWSQNLRAAIAAREVLREKCHRAGFRARMMSTRMYIDFHLGTRQDEEAEAIRLVLRTVMIGRPRPGTEEYEQQTRQENEDLRSRDFFEDRAPRLPVYPAQQQRR